VSDLVQFLRARLDEDERIARAATDGPWRIDNETYAESINAADGVQVVAGGRWGGEASVFDSTEDAIHIAAHDPARVLAEVQAKRMLLDSIIPTMNDFEDKIDEEWGTGDGKHASAAFLRAWARVYRDHADFDPSWLED
jgi:acyl transferase domain-containing protein